MSETTSHGTSLSSCSLISEESNLDRHTRIKQFIVRFVALPFLQGVMLGLGQHGTRYFLSYIVRRRLLTSGRA
jgi:hypothetical protein